ncbi:MAG: hypothetical protein C0606_00790 [Hyphomicrobiales bacterium]|nr:MAG: hypothetical protein C0606_00790 [Hyphomicrobiales bacterium]
MNNSLRIAALAAVMLGTTSQAFAGVGSDMAQAHFEAIGAGDVAAISSAYTDASVFQWVGGPLDGEYRGKDAIAGVWQKFTKAQGPIEVTVGEVVENANPKGVTVTADVTFKGKATVPVRYVLTYRGDALVSEIWQIDPNLGKY